MTNRWLQGAESQRFISILTRFPRFPVDEDAEKEEMKAFERRRMTPSKCDSHLILVKWEKFVLKKGGYDVLRNNIYSKDEWAEADIVSEGLDVSIAPPEQGTAGDQK